MSQFDSLKKINELLPEKYRVGLKDVPNEKNYMLFRTWIINKLVEIQQARNKYREDFIQRD